MTNFHDLDDFTQAYVTCALWSSMDNSDENTGGDPLDKNYGWEDFSPELQAQVIADCKAFQESNLQHFGDKRRDIEQAGHDFWLTRQGHGAGFWNGDWPEEIGKILTKASKAFGEFGLYVGDDGLLYG